MSVSVKVSKAGEDVLGTANTPNDYIFDSTYNTFKILATGGTTITLGENPFSIQEVNVANGQSGVPFVIGFAKYGDRVFGPGQMIYHSGTAPAYSSFFSDIYVDSTNIQFQYGNQQSGVSVTFRYFIVEAPV